MYGNGLAHTRIGTICNELGKYGITATPSDTQPQWLVVSAPSPAFAESDMLWGAPCAAEVFVSDAELLRPDCFEIVLGKVASVVGHPC
ncbi:MAG: hypothetical protein P4L93_01560 [Coriobacteriia bacterium]|nr:hypothetical protein [Coriobacteriia bacterium]